MPSLNRGLLVGAVLQVLSLSCAQTSLEDEAGPPVAVNQSALFTNGGFETGTFGGWTKSTYLNPTGLAVVPPTTFANLQLAAGGKDFSFIRTNAAPMSQLPAGLVAGAGVPLWPRFDLSSAVINEWGATNPPGDGNHQGANQNVNSIKQATVTTSADVDPSDGKVHVRFVLAPILEAAGHVPTQQPYFFVMIRNASRGSAVMSTNFNFANQTGIPWQSQGAGATALLFTSWVVYDFVPDATQFTLGETIEVEVFASGCQPGGHSGSVYVDGFGASLASLAISKIAPTRANIDSDITYTFTVKNLTTGIAPNVVADEVLPPNTTFVSYSAPGATCTTPVVGSAGTISCTYGWLNPGSTNTFTVTAHAFTASSQGTTTAATTTTITDLAQAWAVNAWRGYTAYVTSGAQAGQQAVILSNTATQLTFSPALPGVPAVGSTFKIINPPAAMGASTAVANGSITKAASGWTSNQWLGWNVVMLSGAQAGAVRVVSNNTATQLNLISNWATNPAVGDVFAITKPVTSIVNGDYGVGASTVSRLLGPPRETLMSVGSSFADLSITKSNGVAALVKGQASTVYSITVTNLGPANVTGATVADVIPAELLTPTWTCTAGSGASCAASGAGNINDNTVNLLAGSSVTYALTASVTNGVAISTTNVATVTAPATVIDPFPANNSASDTDTISAVLRVLTVTKSGLSTGLGTVTSAPAGITCGPACPSANASFGDGSSVTLTAVAQPLNRFVGWGGACAAAGTAPTCTVTMSAAQNVTVTFSACGNGTLDSTEGCDDSNITTGDGCNGSCLIETGTACNANASGLTGSFSCASGICDTAGNAAPGVCEAASTCGNSAREAGEGCDDGNLTAGDGCNASCLIETGNTCNASSPGATGNASCASGVCDSVGNAAPGKCEAVNTCGNSVREAGEGCDDGNLTVGDGCNASCKVETGTACNGSAPGSIGGASCASGICDATGNAAPGICEAINTCGNGTREAGEGCDDGNLVAGDGCNASCKIETTRACNQTAPGSTGNASCASGLCDTVGNALPGVCEAINTCGNGTREAGEGCDDGNTTAGDGCNATCKVETGTACNGSAPGLVGSASCASTRCDTVGNVAPGICEALGVCGNGLLEVGEGCDDGNLATGDGCNAACRVETGTACNAAAPGLVGSNSCASLLCDTVGNAAPGICEAAGACGNSVREAGEGCDDGNLTAGDGCNATCKVETGSACNGAAPGTIGGASCASGLCDTVGNASPGRCEAINTCGNGALEAGEGCDDGNLTSGDGCNDVCKVENGRACNGAGPGSTGSASCASGLCDTVGNTAPGVCEALNACGNGVREGVEGCDDGNLTIGDGCNATCKVETGNACNGAAPGSVGNTSCASGQCDSIGNAAPGVCEALNVCGNGLIEATEGCDDGNLTAGDGCNGTCRIETGTACNGSGPGSTGNASCASGLCDAIGNTVPGVCEAIGACGNGLRETGEGCDDANTTAGDGCGPTCLIENGRVCASTGPGFTDNRSCESGICDALGNAAPGVCEPASTCGNSVREAGEGCDDGNATAGDGCSATCLIENARACNVSTPGVVNNASCVSGVCDTTGNASPGLCESAGVCGNGVREAGEGCDDGNASPGDGCNATCLVENGAACNGNAPGATGSASCASGDCNTTNGAPGVCRANNSCGNGVRESAEGCDDGNTTTGDGCNATCLIENGTACNAAAPGASGNASCASGVCDVTGQSAPGVCEAANACGNGVREASEGCDDGNVAGGDGCSATCLIETGKACNASLPGATGSSSCVGGVCDVTGHAAPGVCATANTCGNGVREAGEGCDDGNTTAGDGCSAVCLLDEGQRCNTQTPGAVGNASCSNGRCDNTTGTCRSGGGGDRDGDGVPDVDDLDDDNDGITDVMEGGPDTDTDGDGVPDRLDLDSDGDGILDAFEAGHSQPISTTGVLVCAGGFGTNGLCDALETTPGSGKVSYAGNGTETTKAIDTDGDGVPDFRDLDSDNDGILDATEGGGSCVDGDANGLCDGSDGDGDGISSSADPSGGKWGSGLNMAPVDTDGDGVPDFRDLDSDNDGLSDLVEGGSSCTDTDHDALCDGVDVDGDGLRSTGDGTPNARGTSSASTPPDTDGDGVPDFRDLDSDDDGLADLVEGGSTCTDANNDAVCDAGDADHDGLTDSADGKPAVFGSGSDKQPTVPDTDSDGVPDFRDLQSKGDGTFDIVRAGKARLDADHDGRIDPGADIDHDGLRDSVDQLIGTFGGLPLAAGYRVTGGGCGCSSGDDSAVPGVFLFVGLFIWASKRRRLQRRVVSRGVGVALCVLVAQSALAQTSTAIDVQQFKPGPGKYDLLNVMSPQTCGAGCFATGLWFQYSRNPLQLSDLSNNRIGRLVDNQFTADLLQTFGLTERIDLGFHLPLYIQSTGASDLTNPNYFGAGWVFGAGDLRVVPRVRLVTFDFGLSLGLALPVVLPTGRIDAFMGGRYLGLQPRLLGEFKKGGLTVDLNLGVNFRHFQQLANVSAGNEFAWSAAGEYRLQAGNLPLSVLAGIFGNVGLRDGGQYAGGRMVEADIGVKSTLQDRWALGLTIGRGIVTGVGSPDVRVALSVSYLPACGPAGPSDRDGDGIPDAVDQCPNEPEDRDCFQDDDGCPDPDNDKDGILDAVDACPLEKETVNGYRDDDGCPEKDTDGDGIFDEVDKCPTVAENKNGIEDTDGCPELDSDGDGIFDSVDKCPNAPEDKDGFEDDDGCPDPDNDKDGIPDVKDKCPLQPETINGIEDTDGCPDEGESKVKLEGNKILILDKVYFATGQDVILSRSFNLLTQVASTLLAHEELKKVRVEGHTDDRGDDRANLDLSQRRAASVKRFLVERGVAATRLEAVGYGEVKPVAPNTTPANREMNRRVEFVIVGSDD